MPPQISLYSVLYLPSDPTKPRPHHTAAHQIETRPICSRSSRRRKLNGPPAQNRAPPTPSARSAKKRRGSSDMSLRPSSTRSYDEDDEDPLNGWCRLATLSRMHERVLYRARAPLSFDSIFILAMPDSRMNFPVRLFELMENEAPCESVGWDEPGEVILVHKPSIFLESVLPKYFNRKMRYPLLPAGVPSSLHLSFPL